MEEALNLELNQPRIEYWLYYLLAICPSPWGNIEFSGKQDMEKFYQKIITALTRNLGAFAKGYQSIQ